MARERPDERERRGGAGGALGRESRDRYGPPFDADQPREEQEVGDGDQHRLIPRGERLEHDDRHPRGQSHPRGPGQPAFDRDQRQRNPEAPDQVQVSVPVVHAEETERERHARDERRELIARVPPRDPVHGRCRREVGEDPDDVVRENGISSRRVDGQREERDAEQVLAVRQRVRQRIELVRVEQRRHAIEHGVVVPREHPDERARVAAVAGGREAAEIADGRQHDAAGGHIRESDRGGNGVPSPAGCQVTLVQRHSRRPDSVRDLSFAHRMLPSLTRRKPRR